MENVISKELLSELLPSKQIDKCVLRENQIWFREVKPSSSIKWSDYCINIYELAYMCKEWANIEKGCYLSSGYDGMCKKWEAMLMQITHLADTEPEAIFKACQWILDNKASK